MANRWRVWRDKSEQRTHQKHAKFITREAANSARNHFHKWYILEKNCFKDQRTRMVGIKWGDKPSTCHSSLVKLVLTVRESAVSTATIPFIPIFCHVLATKTLGAKLVLNCTPKLDSLNHLKHRWKKPRKLIHCMHNCYQRINWSPE